MSLYSVGGRIGGTTGAGDEAVGCALWNPHSTVRMKVVEIAYSKTAATVDNPAIQQSSTRGTQTVTVTPDIDNSWERDLSPPSGALLDLDYSADPTLQGPHLKVWNLPAAIGSGFIFSFPAPGIIIPPGTGLAITTHVAVALQIADVTFTWVE
jgi:hypothetical protein